MGSAPVEPYRGIVVATPDAGGFIDPDSIQVSAEPLSDSETSLPSDVELTFPVVAGEPRGDLWLSAVVDLPWVQQAMESVEVADDGSLTSQPGRPDGSRDFDSKRPTSCTPATSR